MRTPTWIRALCLSALALSGSACAADSPVAPSTASAPNALLGSLLNRTTGLVDTTVALTTTTLSDVVQLLTCAPLQDLSASKVIGRSGGTISVGSYRLVVPKGALNGDVTISMTQVSGSANTVRFGPEGLTFAKPAALTMGYANCQAVAPKKGIVYTDEDLNVLETLNARDNARAQSVTAPIGHFSRYAVSW